MFFRVMDKARLPQLVAGLSRDFEIVGPKAKGDTFVLGRIDDPAELRLDYDSTVLPPKKYFVPPAEELMRFRTQDATVTSDTAESVSRVLFGLHPCDINALMLMDNVFLGEFEDPYYKARRDNTLIVGVSCTPTDTCFCNAWGTDEVHWGFDIFLTDLGDRYFVSVRSVKGAELLDALVETRAIEAEDTAEFQAVASRFKAAFPGPIDTAQLPLLLDAKFDDPLWDELGDRCLSCGACSMVCPTCYCFDIKDRLSPDGTEGARVRVWDSCQFSEFAEVAHGHNFRGDRSSRVKYRYYHKQWGYLSKFERVLCVGCGRCERACKADINPRIVIAALQGEGGAL